MKDIINKSILKCMQDNLHIKDYVKFVRSNKKFKSTKHNKYYKDGISLQFQNDNKYSLVIAKRCDIILHSNTS